LGSHLARQLIRCSTSVAANYRSACLAQSKASFIAKISIVLEEVDESAFWLEFIKDEKLFKHETLASLIDEANELKAIFYTSRKTARSNK
jgi:four helix bundle protein